GRQFQPAPPDAPPRPHAATPRPRTAAGRRLQRDLELLTTEPLREPAHASPVRRRDPRSRDLTGLGVDPLRGDLRSMLIQTHYDRHPGPPQAPRFASLRGQRRARAEEVPTREPRRAR